MSPNLHLKKLHYQFSIDDRKNIEYDYNKAIDVDYDLHFGSSNARATLRAPKPLTDLEGLTLAAWVKFDQRDTQGTIMSFYNSRYFLIMSLIFFLMLVNETS